MEAPQCRRENALVALLWAPNQSHPTRRSSNCRTAISLALRQCMRLQVVGHVEKLLGVVPLFQARVLEGLEESLRTGTPASHVRFASATELGDCPQSAMNLFFFLASNYRCAVITEEERDPAYLQENNDHDSPVLWSAENTQLLTHRCRNPDA